MDATFEPAREQIVEDERADGAFLLRSSDQGDGPGVKKRRQIADGYG